jgi:hypothetical protein
LTRHSHYRKALDYAHIRATWAFLSTEERLEKDRGRTLAHNAFIDACNILSRNMAKAGEDNAWRALLTDERKFRLLAARPGRHRDALRGRRRGNTLVQVLRRS